MADSDADTGTPYVKKKFSAPTTYAASGMAPASGVITEASSLSGPWLIETQSLTMDLVRVPGQGLVASSHTITLSGCEVSYGPTQKTNLKMVGVATYERTLDYSQYTTSSYQQPQTFTINSVAEDINGVSYGGSGASSILGVSAFGPMCTVDTQQPFYRRSGTATTPAGGYFAEDYLTDFAFWKDLGCRPGTLRTGSEPFSITNGTNGNIYGAYSPFKESPAFMVGFIDTIAGGIAGGSVFVNPNSLAASAVWNYGRAILPEYNKNRHQY